jgi:hypothetical protein
MSRVFLKVPRPTLKTFQLRSPTFMTLDVNGEIERLAEDSGLGFELTLWWRTKGSGEAGRQIGKAVALTGSTWQSMVAWVSDLPKEWNTVGWSEELYAVLRCTSLGPDVPFDHAFDYDVNQFEPHGAAVRSPPWVPR